MNVTLMMDALTLANRVFQYYVESDVCLKDAVHEEMYVPLKQLVCLLQQASNRTGMVFCGA